MSTKVLLIEDDISLGSLIKDFLMDNGMTVDHVVNGFDALRVKDGLDYDLVICDVMLPDVDGFTLLPRLQVLYSCPFIFMTALDSPAEHVKGLHLGASDYILKPVDPEVLLARIQTALRKAPAQSIPEHIIRHKQIELDKLKHTITYSGKIYQFTAQESDLLWIFLQHEGQTLSREYLFKMLVGREYDGLDRAIDLKVSRLRKHIEDQHLRAIDIKAIRGKGYCLVYQEHA